MVCIVRISRNLSQTKDIEIYDAVEQRKNNTSLLDEAENGKDSIILEKMKSKLCCVFFCSLQFLVEIFICLHSA